MGNKQSTKCALKKKEIAEHVNKTHFDEKEIKLLNTHFKSISASVEDDDVIDKNEFKIALGFKNSLYIDRMFALFDGNGDGNINFEEFIKGLSVLSTKGTQAEKLKISFNIYDFDNDGKISKDDLRQMLQATVEEVDMVMTPPQCDKLIEATFKEADKNKDGFIDQEEYAELIKTHPNMLELMNMNISGLIAEQIQKSDMTEDGSSE